MLDEKQTQQFLQMLQPQGGVPGEGMSPEQQQAIMDQGAQAAQADLAGQGADALPAGVPQDPNAPAQPAAPAAPAPAPAQDPGLQAVQALGFGSVQELAEAFQEKSNGYDQAKDELEKILGFRQALDNTQELDPSDPDFGTKKVFREMFGPIADEFTKGAKLRALAEAWNMDARNLADAEALMPEINAHIQQNPKLSTDPTGFKQAYNAVKAGKHRSEEQLFADPAFIAKAVKNPEVQKAVIQAHLENLARNGEIPPSVGQGGSTPFSGAPAKPTSIEEAGKALGRLLGAR